MKSGMQSQENQVWWSIKDQNKEIQGQGPLYKRRANSKSKFD